MVSEARKDEMLENWWAETDEEWTEEWRDELTPEETALVEQWDNQYCKGMARMAQAILDAEARQQKAPRMGEHP